VSGLRAHFSLVTRQSSLVTTGMETPSLFYPRGPKDELEMGERLQPKFDADGLIPCITVDAATNEVVMFAFMNELALRHTIETGKVTYWSRSRGKLWIKGEESGNFQLVRELRTDCDQDVILVKADIGVNGAACHTGYKSCFYRKLDPATKQLVMAGGTRMFDPALVYKKKS
jgi:phosphoribosyl-AMP cyclohydrolase